MSLEKMCVGLSAAMSESFGKEVPCELALQRGGGEWCQEEEGRRLDGPLDVGWV